MSQKSSTQQAQATRRKTLFPLSAREVKARRANWAWALHRLQGMPIYGVRQVLKCSPDEARSLIAVGGTWTEKP